VEIGAEIGPQVSSWGCVHLPLSRALLLFPLSSPVVHVFRRFGFPCPSLRVSSLSLALCLLCCSLGRLSSTVRRGFSVVLFPSSLFSLSDSL